MEKIQSKVVPVNQPSLQSWLKEFNKPILAITDKNNPLAQGSVGIKRN